MSINKQKLANLIALGVPQAKAALALGVTEGYVSQLVKDDAETRDLIATTASAMTEQEATNDLNLRVIERGLISKVADLVQESDSLGETVRALKDIKAIQAQEALKKAGTPEKVKKVTVNISQVLHANIQVNMNSANQVTDIGERNMATMPTKKVMEVLGAKDKTVQDLIAGT